MSNIEKNGTELDRMDEDEPIVVMTDEEGNEYYYHEELVIPVGEKRYAVLVPLEGGCDCEETDCAVCCSDDGDEVDVFIARIDVDEYGEEIYLDPTDEEFEQVRQVYEKMTEEK